MDYNGVIMDKSPRGLWSKLTSSMRLSHIAFVALAFCSCLLLARWQWSRYSSASGTYRNLGYALQWPFFGLFVVYAYRKFVLLDKATQAHQKQLAALEAAGQTPSAGSGSVPEDSGGMPLPSVPVNPLVNINRRRDVPDGIFPERALPRHSTADVDVSWEDSVECEQHNVFNQYLKTLNNDSLS